MIGDREAHERKYMVYFLLGDNKREVMEEFGKDYDTMKITREHISISDIALEDLAAKITVKQLITKYFIMDIQEYNLVDEGEIKSFLHNEYIDILLLMLNAPKIYPSNKLFVFVDNEEDLLPQSISMFNRSKVINTNALDLVLQKLQKDSRKSKSKSKGKSKSKSKSKDIGKDIDNDKGKNKDEELLQKQSD